MICINLISGKLPASEITRQQVLGKVAPLGSSGSFQQTPLQSSGLPPSLHPRLMERLLGKSPLRLVLARTQVEKGIWRETLECGHEVTAFQDFLWDANGFLVELAPHAKRRRCQKCKPEVAPALKTRAEISADQSRAEFIHRQKLKFGSLFDVMCFPDGELRPAQSEAELFHALGISSGSRVAPVGPHSAINAHDAGDGVSLPDSSPRKPRSIRDQNRKAENRMSTKTEPRTAAAINIKRYRDDPAYGTTGAFAARVDWIETMHANLDTPDKAREFMVRLISLLECDVQDGHFEKRVLDVLKAMKRQSEVA
jgi:hypothetical protein